MVADRQLTIRRVLERWDLTRDGGIGQLAEAIDEAIEVPLEPAQVDASLSSIIDAAERSKRDGEVSLSYAEFNAMVSALRSRPAVVDAEVMAVVERIDELHAAYIKADKAFGDAREYEEAVLRSELGEAREAFYGAFDAWPTLSAALRSGRTK